MNSKARNRVSKRQAILKLTLRNNPEVSLRRSNGLLPILDSRISFRVVLVDDCVEEPVSQRRYSSTTKRTLVGAWIISMRQISPSKRRDQPLQRLEGWMIHLREIVQGWRSLRQSLAGFLTCIPRKVPCHELLRCVTSMSEILFIYQISCALSSRKLTWEHVLAEELPVALACLYFHIYSAMPRLVNRGLRSQHLGRFCLPEAGE